MTLPILFGYVYYLYRKNKECSQDLKLGLLLFCFIIGSILVIHYLYLELSYKVDSNPEIQGMIVDIKDTESTKRLTIKTGKFKTYAYIYSNSKFEVPINLKIGDIVEVSGMLLTAEDARIEGGFNYQEHLKRKRITKSIICEELIKTDSKFHIGIIRFRFLQLLDKHFDGMSLTFLKAMIIGDDNGFSLEFKKAVTDNGTLHLFAVSGSHIALFVLLVTSILNYFKFKEKTIDTITCSFLFIYLILTNFQASVVRSALMYGSLLVNKKLKLGFSPVDILSFAFIILIIIDPYYMYDLGFVLSFLATGTILLISPIIENQKHFKQLFTISLLVMIVTLPVVINVNNEFNLLSPITNMIFVDLVEGIILPISLIVLVLPILKIVYEYLLIAFYEFTILISEKIIIKLRFPNFSITSIIIYYSLLFLFIRFYQNKKLKTIISIIMIVFLFILSNITIGNSSTEIDFLDLYNGEAILIRESHNGCNALIDTGDGKNNEVTNYLKREGVKRLDYLILTHNHLDHNGEARNIINEIKVKNLVLSAYDSSVYSNKDLKINLIDVKEKDKVSCGKLEFLILHPDKKYSNENDNSIVIYSKIGEYNFLFLGDISTEVDEKFTRMNLVVDVIKIAHHGSKTSTSSKLISALKPKYAIIQTGRLEKFAFPHKEPINILKANNVIVLRTDELYSIKYQYKKNKSIFIFKNGNTNFVH